ncbi:hypothetical protein [Oryza sativa Japonica Group]|uniref:Uncharacterized protein n=1 Tax=Oryza sativa subsp. japonica TaxID=39947 RepID=Q5ZBS6_ORYSJ|nr:hypothetical protein [Oryza sativa Japonica Group]
MVVAAGQPEEGGGADSARHGWAEQASRRRRRREYVTFVGAGDDGRRRMAAAAATVLRLVELDLIRAVDVAQSATSVRAIGQGTPVPSADVEGGRGWQVAAAVRGGGMVGHPWAEHAWGSPSSSSSNRNHLSWLLTLPSESELWP